MIPDRSSIPTNQKNPEGWRQCDTDESSGRPKEEPEESIHLKHLLPHLQELLNENPDNPNRQGSIYYCQ